MKRLLREYFELGSGIFQTKDGKGRQVIFIDPEISENTYPLKDDLKKKFSASWIAQLKTWGWFVNDNVDMIVDRFVRPCLEFLIQNEETPKGGLDEPEDRDIQEEIQKIIQQLNQILEVKPQNNLDEEAQQKLEDFRKRILAIFNGDNPEDRNKIDSFIFNLIDFRNEQKKHNHYVYKDEFNQFLIMMGHGTDVRPLGEWTKMGYEPKPNAHIFRLLGKRYKTIPFTKKEKESYIEWYLKQKGIATVEELPPSSQYDLFQRRLKGGKRVGDRFKWYFFDAYDRKDMTPKEGAEVEPEEPETDWWWDKVEATDKDKTLCTALAQFAQSPECGSLTVNLDVDRADLGGARGDASNHGHINIVNDGNIRFPTFVHELTHELKHWAFASKNNPSLKRFHSHRNILERDEKQEQEADLCAAFVCEKYGYDISSRINYVYSWGLNEDNCCAVLDNIAETADFITNGLEKYINEDDLNKQ